MSERKYWQITENDVYVRVFREMLDELDLSFFPQDVIQSYEGLSLEEQYLVTRLFLRSVKWLRKSDLEKYLPPDKLQTALDNLVEAKWLLTDPNIDAYLEVATVKELQQVATDFNIKRATSRPQLVAAIEELCRRKTFFGPPLEPKVAGKLKIAVTPLYLLNGDMASTLTLLAFMFMTPARLSLDVIVRTNMRMISFYDYEYVPQKEAPIFPTKRDFAEYYNARVLCDPLEESAAAATDELAAIVLAAASKPSEHMSPFSASYVYGRALFLISGFLGKAGRFQDEYEMIERYFDQNSHKSKRSALIIRKLNLELKFHKELQEPSWLTRALNTYFDAIGIVNDIDKFDLSRKATRMARELEKSGMSAPPLELSKYGDLNINSLEAEQLELQPGTGIRTRWGSSEASNTVEDTALEHYAEHGWAGGHYENSMMTTIFWLLLHDIIFSDKQTFRCRYHVRPLSLQKVLDAHMDEIRDRLTTNDLEALALAAYAGLSEKTPSIGSINWSIPAEGISAVITGLGASLPKILLRLAENYSTFSSGFPDLTLWPIDADAGSGCKIVEVKSTNDTLSDNQYVWIQFLTELGVSVEICKIKGKRKRSEQA